MKTTSAKLRHAAANALCIARQMPSDSFTDRAWIDRAGSVFSREGERVADAAQILAEIESSPGFNWEEQSNDWETVCAYIAKLCTSLKPINHTAIIAQLSK